MDTKKNDKYKKRYILKQIEGKWGYYEFEGDIILIKNCILKNKYNKIYQLIFHGGDAIDGLYLINAFDINMHYDTPEERIITITNKKYDKIAGYDDCTIHSFATKEKFIDWLIQEEFLTNDELVYLKSNAISKNNIKELPRFVLDS